MEQVPDKLKNAAIAQILAGLINFFVMGYVAWFGIGTVCGLLTFLIGGLGGLCGMVGCLLVPFGLVEIAVGALALSNPKQYGNLCRTLGFVEMGALLLGGIPSAIVGLIVVQMTGSDEVKLFLEG